MKPDVELGIHLVSDRKKVWSLAIMEQKTQITLEFISSRSLDSDEMEEDEEEEEDDGYDDFDFSTERGCDFFTPCPGVS